MTCRWLPFVLFVGCAHSNVPNTPPTKPKSSQCEADAPTTRQEIADILKPTLDEAPERRAIGVVLIDEDQTYVFGFGPRNEQDRRPMDADTTFELGSIAKTMVGVLLASSAERGEVQLDDRAEKWLPKDVTLSPKLRPVTLAQLGTLTTGFPWFPDNWIGVDPSTQATRYTRETFRDFLKTFEPTEPPGTSFHYGNTDTALLALVLAERAQLPIAKLLAERVFAPVGMKRTEIADRVQKDANRLDGYAADGSLLAPRIDHSPFAPTCAVRSTLGDVSRYLRAALGDPSPLRSAFALSQKPRFPLDPDGVRQMALGWEHSSRFDSVSKNGVVEGYRTSMTLFPKKRQAVFVVANVDTDSLAFDIAAYELAPEPLGLVDHARFVVKDVPEDARRVAVSFNYVRLEGVRAPTCIRPGETLAVSFYFRTIEETSGDFRIFVHGDAPTGNAPRLRADHFPNGGKGSTIQWLKDEVIRDDFSIPIPKDYVGKSLVLWTGLFDEGGRLDAMEEIGESEVIDNRFRGPTIAVGACP
jgi:CubicO group peptidase (beta-lactamase class C family)